MTKPILGEEKQVRGQTNELPQPHSPERRALMGKFPPLLAKVGTWGEKEKEPLNFFTCKRTGRTTEARSLEGWTRVTRSRDGK